MTDTTAAAETTKAADVSWYDEFVVEPNYEGWRLDRFLAEKIRRASRSKVLRFLKTGLGAQYSDGRAARPGHRLQSGQRIWVPRRNEGAEHDAESIADAPTVVAEGSDWLALNKPAGLLVHRTAREALRTVEVWLQSERPGERWEPVHRLDRETSGVLVCAKGVNAIRSLRESFAGARVEKIYDALVTDQEEAWKPGDCRRFEQPLGPDASSKVALRIGTGEWPCATEAECLARAGEIAWLQVRIEQGRQHQIRAHLALFGTPIRGDKLYEAGDAFFLQWLRDPSSTRLAQLPSRWHCLHARRAVFPEPSGEKVAVEAPPPPHFAQLWPGHTDWRQAWKHSQPFGD